MTRPTRREAERRLEDVEEQRPNGTGWRDDLNLPGDAPRSQGWIAELTDDVDDNTWRKYVAEGVNG